MFIGASGVVRGGTGIGVLQRALYPRLEAAGVRIVESRNRDLGAGRIRAVKGLLLGLRAARGQFDGYLSVVPPFPLRTGVPTVSIVHDLRWRHTRGLAGRAYRHWDLRRTVRLSHALICISERTREDLLEVFPNAASKSSVAWLGPGLAAPVLQEAAIEGVRAGTLLMIGGAAHKRNELAASMVAHLPDGMITRVIGVGVSEAVKSRIDGLRGVEAEWFARISDDDLRALYARSQYFALLGTDEGFGLPYIEALAMGCTVIATDQPLTRELLGSAGILLPLGSPEAMARALIATPSPNPDECVRASARYSWDSFADRVYDALESASSSLSDLPRGASGR